MKSDDLFAKARLYIAAFPLATESKGHREDRQCEPGAEYAAWKQKAYRNDY